MSEDDNASIAVYNGVLKVDRDLYWESLSLFEKACNKLLGSRNKRLEMDLSSVNFLSSSYMGCLGSMMLRAARSRKKVVIKASRDISWLFDILGGQKWLDMEVV